MRIKEIAQYRGLTLAELAAKMGITYQSLFNIMNGNPTLSKLKEIAKILDVNVSDLIDDDNNHMRCPHCGGIIEVFPYAGDSKLSKKNREKKKEGC
ncbi:MAG: helix-turn-helix transcriptional regulator [Bacteroidaceae bacterium]|nr:helix-turn-helix transcriptional regulator [Bacteroidaceae bacterium]